MSVPYWWFEGASVSELRKQLNAMGDDGRLEVHCENHVMTFRVMPKAEKDATARRFYPEINESHVCPPQC